MNTKAALATWAAASVLLVAATASAELNVRAFPVVGADTPLGPSWTEIAVRIDNDDTRVAKGTLVLNAPTGYMADASVVTTAAFSVAAGATVTVRMPSHGLAHASGPFTLVVRGEDGAEMHTTEVASGNSISPFLVDTSEPPRLSGVLKNAPVAVGFDPTNGMLVRPSGSGKSLIATGNVTTEPATGDPVLPERAAGYASTTIVVMRSDQLVRLAGQQLQALADYVLAGGTLALQMERPEDYRHPTLVALLGAETSPDAVDAMTRRTPGDQVEMQDDPRQPARRRVPSLGQPVWPSDEVEKGLRGFRGGNLRTTVWGAAASYGLGEVHLLAFDPTRGPGVDDAWVRSRMVDLVQHAWQRRRFVVTSHGSQLGTEDDVRDVRRVLDPNEHGRWAIVVAALLLTIYSVLAGPLNFARAAKRGRPLRALWHLPIWSLIAFLVIVFIGISAKGWTGRARHLTLVEAGAGMSKAAARRYRAFFTSDSRSLTVRATDVASVLDAATAPRAGAKRTLVVDRDGVQLQGLSTMPWETVLVREDGFSSLSGGVSIVRDASGGLVVVNRTARDLRAVLLVVPADASPNRRRQSYYFPRIRDGESKPLSEGKEVAFEPWTSTSHGLRELENSSVGKDLERESSGLTAAWTAVASTTSFNAEWWPSEVPVLLAQVDGGEGRSSDSGLRTDQDRVLLRVMGYGGLP